MIIKNQNRINQKIKKEYYKNWRNLYLSHIYYCHLLLKYKFISWRNYIILNKLLNTMRSYYKIQLMKRMFNDWKKLPIYMKYY